MFLCISRKKVQDANAHDNPPGRRVSNLAPATFPVGLIDLLGNAIQLSVFPSLSLEYQRLFGDGSGSWSVAQ